MNSTSTQKYLLLPLLIFLLSIQKIKSKTITDTIKLTGEKTEHTIVKFAISPNTQGKFHATITTKSLYRNYDKKLKLFFFNGENIWKKVKRLPTCEEKIKHSTFEKTIQLEPYKALEGNEYHYKYEVTTGLMTNLQYPDYWYITISDCSLELYYHESEQESPGLHYTADIYNQYQKGIYSHVSYDQRYMKKIHTITLFTSCIIIVIVVLRCVRINQIQHEIHIGCIIVLVLTIMQILSTVCQYMHLIKYEYDGIGYYTLDALSAYFESIVDSIMSLLLLAISSGWTLPNDIIISSPNRNILLTSLRSTQVLLSPSHSGNPLVSIFIFSIFAIHFILAQWGRIYNDDFDSYHDLEHLPGRILFMFRIVLGVLFLYNIATLRYKSVHMTTSLSKFYIFFGLLGLGWFITIPLCAFLFVSTLLYSYQRHYVVECICCFIQCISLYGMTWLFFFGWDLKNNSNDGKDKNMSAFHKISKVGNGRDNIDSIGLDGNDGSNSGYVRQSLIKFGKTKIRLD